MENHTVLLVVGSYGTMEDGSHGGSSDDEI